MQIKKMLRSTTLLLCIVELLFSLLLEPTPVFASNQNPVHLQSAADYQLLAGTVLTIGAATLGTQPDHDGVSTTAVADLALAIAGVAGLTFTSTGADLGGNTFTPGNYEAVGGAAFAITSNITLDAQGDASSFFIFYTPAAMNTSAGIVINLINNAQPMNVYWVTGGAVTTGASGILVGTFMSSAAITTGASSTFSGCLLGAAAVTIGAANILQECLHPVVLAPSGFLTISVPATTELLISASGLSASGSTGLITVTDTRLNSGTNNWIVVAESSSLVNPATDAIPATAISYSVIVLPQSDPITVTTHDQTTLSSALAVVNSTGAITTNSYSWKAQIVVKVPLNQPIGIYAGTITHSVS